MIGYLEKEILCLLFDCTLPLISPFIFLASFRLLYGDEEVAKMGELERPIAVQFVYTNGQRYFFSAFQGQTTFNAVLIRHVQLTKIGTELIGSLKLGNILAFVQHISGLPWPMNQLNKTPNIASLETSYHLF